MQYGATLASEQPVCFSLPLYLGAEPGKGEKESVQVRPGCCDGT